MERGSMANPVGQTLGRYPILSSKWIPLTEGTRLLLQRREVVDHARTRGAVPGSQAEKLVNLSAACLDSAGSAVVLLLWEV